MSSALGPFNRRDLALGLAALALTGCGEKKPAAAPEAKAPAAPPRAPELPIVIPVLDLNALKALLDRTVALRGVPGMAAAVVNAQGVVFSAASGVRRKSTSDPVSVRDAWHIGSDTKAMTAALYARLVDQKRAKWGATLPELFPTLAASMDPAWRAITIEQLMSHRAGLDDVGVPWLNAARADHRPLPEQRLATAADKLSKPPAKPVGQFAYANVGYIIVGSAIEQILKTSWEEAIAAQVFDPLGMRDAGFGPPKGEAPQGHRLNPLTDMLSAVGDGPTADNPAALGPAGTVHVTLDDWARFIRVFLDPKQTFLKPDSLQHLITPAAGASYAMGWGIIDDPKAGRLLSHAGSNTMWFAQAVIARDRNAAVLVTANCATDAGQQAVAMVTNALLLGQLAPA
ncbi:MAG: serine hydrolase domain-containing protein [Alphaproteobacteria bacterium]